MKKMHTDRWNVCMCNIRTVEHKLFTEENAETKSHADATCSPPALGVCVMCRRSSAGLEAAKTLVMEDCCVCVFVFERERIMVCVLV